MSDLVQEVSLPWGFPTLNDLLHMTSKHWTLRSKAKKQWQHVIQLALRQAKIKPLSGAVDVTLEFIPPNGRRDPDNASAVVRKYALDALQAEGIIEQDNWSGISGLHDEYHEPNKDDPKIILKIKGELK